VLDGVRRRWKIAKEPFRDQATDQATQASRETGPLLGGQRGDDPGLPGLPGPPHPGRDPPALGREIQPDIPLVLLVAATPIQPLRSSPAARRLTVLFSRPSRVASWPWAMPRAATSSMSALASDADTTGPPRSDMPPAAVAASPPSEFTVSAAAGDATARARDPTAPVIAAGLTAWSSCASSPTSSASSLEGVT
jgi:hypothetical protein